MRFPGGPRECSTTPRPAKSNPTITQSRFPGTTVTPLQVKKNLRLWRRSSRERTPPLGPNPGSGRIRRSRRPRVLRSRRPRVGSHLHPSHPSHPRRRRRRSSCSWKKSGKRSSRRYHQGLSGVVRPGEGYCKSGDLEMDPEDWRSSHYSVATVRLYPRFRDARTASRSICPSMHQQNVRLRS